MSVTVITWLSRRGGKVVGRWEPDAPGRLRRAAFELYDERGYEATTVTDIAQRAGVTERTYFRHFPDKREVLFAGGELLDAMLEALDASPKESSALDQVVAALEAADVFFGDGEQSRRRQRVIDSHPELQERELTKLASIAAALQRRLQDRGVHAPAATLAAQTGLAVFRVAFDRWINGSSRRRFSAVLAATLKDLTTLAAQAAAADGPLKPPSA